jgi:type I restriction enzyme S subunit
MKFTQYEKYKDSELDWLGEIPEHWEVKRLKEWIKLISGGGTPTTTKNEYWSGNIPWVSPKDMKTDYINKAEDYITKLAIKESATTLIQPNQVLMVVRSGILKHTLPVAINKVEVALNQDMKAFKPNKKLLFHFLFWKLKGQSGDILTMCQKVGATVESIEMGNLLVFPFAVPCINEQSAISNYLDEKTAQIDKKIEILQAKKERFLELRKTLINDAVTKGLDKTVELKDSGIEWLGQIPKHWKVKRSKSLFKNVSIKNKPNEKLLSVYRDYGVIEKDSRDDNHNRASDDLANYKFVKKGFLIINKMKAWQGSVAISNYQGIVSPAYITCKPIDKIYGFYFHYLLRSVSCITEFQRFSFGVRPDQWDLRYDNFADFQFTVPPISEQIAIAEYLDEKTSKIDKIITAIDENIEALNEFRKTLINDAVTGKIKIAESEDKPNERTATTG